MFYSSSNGKLICRFTGTYKRCRVLQHIRVQYMDKTNKSMQNSPWGTEAYRMASFSWAATLLVWRIPSPLIVVLLVCGHHCCLSGNTVLHQDVDCMPTNDGGSAKNQANLGPCLHEARMLATKPTGSCNTRAYGYFMLIHRTL